MRRLLLLLAVVGLWLTPIGVTAADSGFTVRQCSDRIEITCDGHPVAQYVFRDERIIRPYFCDVRAPGGIQVTRNHPPLPGKYATDHDTLHQGLWLAFGDINGQDFWRNKGRMEHVRFIEPPQVEKAQLTFATESLLRATDGKSVCSLTNRFTLRQMANAWLLVWEASFRSEDGDVTFGDQEEMGFGARRDGHHGEERRRHHQQFRVEKREEHLGPAGRVV